jgi:hypothetical protein
MCVLSTLDVVSEGKVLLVSVPIVPEPSVVAGGVVSSVVVLSGLLVSLEPGLPHAKARLINNAAVNNCFII